MTIKDIIAEWLARNGYDGLYDGEGCGCRRDELMPCGEPKPDCIAGVTCGPDGQYIGPHSDWTPEDDEP